MAEKQETQERPEPTLQPALPREPFGTDEILWWDNGIWGEAGYAIPNPSGKTWTQNSVAFAIHRFIGHELFSLVHRPDVRFTRPPNREWLYDVAKMLKLGMKRLSDRSIGWNDRRLDGEHATPGVRSFVVYPVPFFGERIRQADAKEWTGLVLMTLSEIMQHSDNDLDNDVTDFLTSTVHERFHRIQYLLATKYLGVARETAISESYVIPDDAFSGEHYRPDALFTKSEMVEERNPLLWWPTENDLSPIKGVPVSTALAYARRWPDSQLMFAGDSGSATAFPGGGALPGDPRFVRKPGGAP